jgi:hypothetical protein
MRDPLVSQTTTLKTVLFSFLSGIGPTDIVPYAAIVLTDVIGAKTAPPDNVIDAL